MSRNTAGKYQLPLNPVLSGTPVLAQWANTTLSDVAAELSDSLSRSGKGGMLGPFKVADGSLATPGLAFTSETSTGFWRAAAGDMRLSVLGMERLKATSGNTAPAWTFLSPQAADGTMTDFVLNTVNDRAAGSLLDLQNATASRLRVTHDGTLYLGSHATIQPTATNAITLLGSQEATAIGADIILGSMTTRTAGSLLDVRNNAESKLLVRYDGAICAATPGSPVLLFGNRAAASAASDVVVDSTVARTGGVLLECRNHGTTEFYVGAHGELGLFGQMYAIPANVGLSLVGNADAGSGGTDLLVTSKVTRTAGTLLSVQNNGVPRFAVGADGTLYQNGVVFGSPGGGTGGESFVHKASDQVLAGLNSSGYVDVSGVSFTMEAGASYIAEVTGFLNRTDSGSGNVRFLFTGPGATNCIMETITVDAAAGAVRARVTNGFGTLINAHDAVGPVVLYTTVKMHISGASAGTVQMQLGAQSGATVVVPRGFMVRLRRM